MSNGEDQHNFQLGDIVEVTDPTDPDFGCCGEVQGLGPPIEVTIMRPRPVDANKIEKREDLSVSYNELRRRAKEILGSAKGNKVILTSRVKMEVLRASGFKVGQNVEVIDRDSEFFMFRGVVVASGPPILVELEGGAGTRPFSSNQLEKKPPFL